MRIGAAIKADLPKDKQIMKEFERLWQICVERARNDADLLVMLRKMVQRAAFLGVMLDRFEKDISENGYEEEYQNGQNQKGTKKRTAADLHASYTKSYITVMRHIADALPPAQSEEADDFDSF